MKMEEQTERSWAPKRNGDKNENKKVYQVCEHCKTPHRLSRSLPPSPFFLTQYAENFNSLFDVLLTLPSCFCLSFPLVILELKCAEEKVNGKNEFLWSLLN